MSQQPNFMETVCLEEVRTQCESVLYALEQFNKRIREVHLPERSDGRHTPSSEVFRALHSLLAHSANLSRLLFPERKRDTFARTRGRMLREVLSVDEQSPFSDSRLRAHQALYDELFDSWVQAASPDKASKDRICTSADLGGGKPNDAIRTYLTDTRELILMGHTYDVVPLVTEARRLQDEVSKLIGASG